MINVLIYSKQNNNNNNKSGKIIILTGGKQIEFTFTKRKLFK